ncbi:MAG: malonyl-[acyl-carrier protein] O-methyltransferase BioC [Gammaproteobacteria bacterium HGW-Gammaproteobacteria-3]|nr:MAG: malonyl-[acyl-carrier protein] O-methyltransferase BioC [Gammaproteobacteria bacterium HGW-Gammaproteobacteria-3]
MNAVFTLNKAKIRQSFGAASASYDTVARLQRTVGRQLLKTGRLCGVSGTILDLGCGTGFLTAGLLQFTRVEHVLALDMALPMLQKTRQRLKGATAVSYLCADAEHLALAPDSMDRIFSNLALQWCRDLPTVFSACRTILKPGGALVFSTFGPQTLGELKQAWAQVDTCNHVNAFYEANELIRFLTAAGFTGIQLETRCLRPAYPSVLALMQELKAIGARNAANGRNKQITSKRQMQQMIAAYPESEREAIYATFEVISVLARVPE